MAREAPKKRKKKRQSQPTDDFESVAKRLECDEDRERFEKALGKVAKAKPIER